MTKTEYIIMEQIAKIALKTGTALTPEFDSMLKLARKADFEKVEFSKEELDEALEASFRNEPEKYVLKTGKFVKVREQRQCNHCKGIIPKGSKAYTYVSAYNRANKSSRHWLCVGCANREANEIISAYLDEMVDYDSEEF